MKAVHYGLVAALYRRLKGRATLNEGTRQLHPTEATRRDAHVRADAYRTVMLDILLVFEITEEELEKS